MSTKTHPDQTTSRTRRSGSGTEPPLGPLVALATLLFVGGVVAGTLTGAPMPSSPLAEPGMVISTYVTEQPGSLLVTALGILTAAYLLDDTLDS